MLLTISSTLHFRWHTLPWGNRARSTAAKCSLFNANRRWGNEKSRLLVLFWWQFNFKIDFSAFAFPFSKHSADFFFHSHGGPFDVQKNSLLLRRDIESVAFWISNRNTKPEKRLSRKKNCLVIWCQILFDVFCHIFLSYAFINFLSLHAIQ